MDNKYITFDEVFKIWLDAEVMQIEGRDILPVAQSKGFASIAEWRLTTALRLGMNTKKWTLETINNPTKVLPNIIIGPYQGWSKFFENRITTTFAQALEIKEFLEWCNTHDRIMPLSKNFPLPTTVILFRTESGELIHVEGGHRICAVAYANKIGSPIKFENKPPVSAAVAPINAEEISNLIEFLKQGTFKQTKAP